MSTSSSEKGPAGGLSRGVRTQCEPPFDQKAGMGLVLADCFKRYDVRFCEDVPLVGVQQLRKLGTSSERMRSAKDGEVRPNTVPYACCLELTIDLDWQSSPRSRYGGMQDTSDVMLHVVLRKQSRSLLTGCAIPSSFHHSLGGSERPREPLFSAADLSLGGPVPQVFTCALSHQEHPGPSAASDKTMPLDINLFRADRPGGDPDKIRESQRECAAALPGPQESPRILGERRKESSAP
eukprot:scaffold79_cov259-Pinguiococcus_pyrenoidosus.AAC.7